ncbi:MAG TPA: FAD-binding oxidoreductase [Steroidobacteraceae bacterium]
MKIGPGPDRWQLQRSTSSPQPRPGIGRRGFLGTTLAAGAFAATHAGRLWADAAHAAAIPAQVPALSGTGKPLVLNAADIKELRASLRGVLLLASDADYDSVRRVWNPSFDRHPALIVRCAETTDVVRAVNFARAHDLRTAVRGGGHSLSGQSMCDGGLVIDMSPMKGITVDTGQRLTRAQGGVLLGELDRKTQAVGLATTMGTATDTGIAGLTLGGGMGRLMRLYGLACDNLKSVEIVTADGKARHLSAHDDPELFWGVRGGGGNFGVATSFEYHLHPLAHKVLTGERVYPYSQARTVFAAVAELAARAPDELQLSAEVFNTTRGPNVGRYVAWSVDYCGDPAAGERLLEPLRSLGKPLLDTIGAVSYLAAQGAEGAATAAVPSQTTIYTKSGFFHRVSPQLFDELVRRFATLPADLDVSAGMDQMAGAMARIAPDATAFWNRPAQYDFLINGNWGDRTKSEQFIADIHTLWDGIAPFTEGYYVNTEPGADDKRLRATYGENYARLVQLKNKIDPANLFSLNANIKPTVRI